MIKRRLQPGAWVYRYKQPITVISDDGENVTFIKGHHTAYFTLKPNLSYDPRESANG